MKEIEIISSGTVVRLCLLSALILGMLICVIIRRKYMSPWTMCSGISLILTVLCKVGYHIVYIIALRQTVQSSQVSTMQSISTMQSYENIRLGIVALEGLFLLCALVFAYLSLRRKYIGKPIEIEKNHVDKQQ